jgi:hypothetical protein
MLRSTLQTVFVPPQRQQPLLMLTLVHAFKPYRPLEPYEGNCCTRTYP